MATRTVAEHDGVVQVSAEIEERDPRQHDGSEHRQMDQDMLHVGDDRMATPSNPWMAELGMRSLLVMPEMFRSSGVGTQSMKTMRPVSTPMAIAAS